MPLYEYQCDRCGRFEVIRKFSDSPLLTCPTCGGEIQKLFSAPAIQFKGTGWYITDYARKSSGSGEGKGGEGKGGEGKGGESKGGEGKGEAGASASGAKDGGSSSKDSGSASSDTGAKAAASTDSSPAKGGSGGRSTK